MFSDAFGQQHARVKRGARIVSLVPSITELLFDLGLHKEIVGRTGFCIHPRESVRGVPKLGGTKDIDFDGLRTLNPTHVIVNIDENTREAFERLRAMVPNVVVTHPNAPRDNVALFEMLGGIFDREAEATTLARRFSAALAALESGTRDLPERRVVYLIWRDPWMAVAPDTYISNMLASINWRTLPQAAEPRYPSLAPAELAGMNADLCLLSSEPYPFRDKHVAEVDSLARPRLGTQLVDGEMLSWYGSRAIEGVAYLGRLAQDHAARAA